MYTIINVLVMGLAGVFFIGGGIVLPIRDMLEGRRGRDTPRSESPDRTPHHVKSSMRALSAMSTKDPSS